jgi:hypothetical protein
VDTKVVADELDLVTAASLKDLLESSGISAEVIGARASAFPGMPQMGGYGILVPAESYDEARRLVDELEREVGEPPAGGR